MDPENDFSMQWAVMPSANARMRAISQSLEAAQALILATDPDREGEAIAWHVQEILQVYPTLAPQLLGSSHIIQSLAGLLLTRAAEIACFGRG